MRTPPSVRGRCLLALLREAREVLLRVGFCRSGNVKAATRQFLAACVRFGVHTGLQRTVESTAAKADQQSRRIRL
jgi:hypothetical protein